MRKRILWISLLITMLGMLLFSVMATHDTRLYELL